MRLLIAIALLAGCGDNLPCDVSSCSLREPFTCVNEQGHTCQCYTSPPGGGLGYGFECEGDLGISDFATPLDLAIPDEGGCNLDLPSVACVDSAMPRDMSEVD